MKILIVKLSSLGDVIQTIPVVHDLTKAFPGVIVDWVVEEAFASLVARVSGVRRVLPMGEENPTPLHTARLLLCASTKAGIKVRFGGTSWI